MSAEKKVVHVNIDCSAIAKIAQVGVRRAALFLGLGLNGVNQPGFRDYELHKLPRGENLAVVPPDIIEPEFGSHVDALYSARNSLSHRLGIVRVEDAAPDGTLLLRWLAIEMHAHGEETNSVIPLGKLFGEKLPEPMSIRIGTVKRELSYKVGDKITLAAQDLYEICLFMSVHVIPKAMVAFVQFLKDQGVEGASTGDEASAA